MSKQKKYSIVEFSDGIQIVPSCWIDISGNNCIWPGYVKSQYTLDKLLAKAVLPAKSAEWDTCKIIRIFGSADSWERAQEKLVNAAETSTIVDSEDFSEEEWASLVKERRRSNARKTYDFSSASSNEGKKYTLHRQRKDISQDYRHHARKKKGNQSNNILQLPSLPKVPSNSFLSQSHVISNVSPKASTSRIDETQRNVPISDKTLVNTSVDSALTLPSPSHFRRSASPAEVLLKPNVLHNSFATTDFQNFVTRSMTILLRRTKNIEDKICNFENRQRQVEDYESDGEEFVNPLCTEEQLLEFEKN